MLGGAALAGGLLAQAGARKQTTRAATGGAGSAGASAAPPPDLPPLPVDGSSPDLPPVPTGEAEPEVPQELLYAIVRTMVAAALADGELEPEEKKLIDDQLLGSELDGEQAAQIRRDLIVPATVQELAGLLPEGEDAEALARFAVLVARADGEQSEEETAWLESLAEALAMPPGSIDRLTSEIFER